MDVVFGTEFFGIENSYSDISGSSDDDSSEDDDNDEDDDEDYSVYSDSEEEGPPGIILPLHIQNNDFEFLGSDDDDTDYSEGMEIVDEASEEDTDESVALNDCSENENVELPAKRNRLE